MSSDRIELGRGDSRTAAALLALAVAGAVLAVHGRSLGFGLMSDDFAVVQHAREGLRAIWTQPFPAGTGFYYRPLPLTTLAAGAPGLHHGLNLLLHAVTALLLGRLALRLGARPPVAGAAALLLAVHPVTVDPVAWLSARSDLLCAIFYLAACGLFVAAVRGCGGRATALGAAAAAVAAGLAKETGLTVAGAFLVLAVMEHQARPLTRAGRRTAAALVGTAGAAALVQSAAVLTLWGDPAARFVAPAPGGAVVVLLVAGNAVLGVVPDHLLRRLAGAAEWGVVVGAGTAALAAVVALGLARRTHGWRGVRQLAAALLLPLPPLLPLMLIGSARSRLMYLPLALLLAALCWLLRGVPRPGRWAAGVLAAAVLLGALAFTRVGVWSANARLARGYADSFRALAPALPEGATLVLVPAPARRLGAPVLGNDALWALHAAVGGRGPLPDAVVVGELEVIAAADPGAVVTLAGAREPGVLHLRAAPGRGFLESVPPPRLVWRVGPVKIQSLQADGAGDVVRARVRIPPGAVVLTPARGGRLRLVGPPSSDPAACGGR